MDVFYSWIANYIFSFCGLPGAIYIRIIFRKLPSPPCARREQKHHGEYFKPSGQHIKNEYKLGEFAEARKIAGGPYGLQPGADIVEGCQYRRKVGGQRKAVNGYDKEAYDDDHDVGDKIGRRGGDDPFVYRLPVDSHHFDLVGVDGFFKVAVHGFQQQDHADAFEPASGTARARAYYHQEYKNCLREIRPQVKIRCGKSGGRYDARYLKGGVPYVFSH